MFIDADNGQSKVQIGGYDLNKYATTPLHWYDLSPQATFWEVGFGGTVTVGDLEFTPSVSKIMADTGTSLNMLPTADY